MTSVDPATRFERVLGAVMLVFADLVGGCGALAISDCAPLSGFGLLAAACGMALVALFILFLSRLVRPADLDCPVVRSAPAPSTPRSLPAPEPASNIVVLSARRP